MSQRGKTNRYRLLLVEDEAPLVRTLTDFFTSQGYQIESIRNGREGLERASAEAFDLILLDVMLPGMSGFDVCKELRQREIDTPILMLTARSEIGNKVTGFRTGADDYLTKPFDVLELQVRVEALLRRAPRRDDDIQRFEAESFSVDFTRGVVESHGSKTSLSDRECRLLNYFVRHKGETLSRDELLQEVWGYDQTPFTRTVDVHIVWLRQKIEADPKNPKHIVTVHGQGYRFVANPGG